MTLYFGYGSNLDALDWRSFCARWDFRGAKLVPVTQALLLDTELVFDRYAVSRRGGALNLRDRPGQAVDGMIFRPNATALRALDVKEGAPRHYRRVYRQAVLPDGTVADVMTYVAPSQGFHAPHADYLAVVRRGKAAHGLAQGMLEEAALGAVPRPAIRHLFVYGTLMTGEANAHHLAGLSRRSGMVRGVLHDCGPYPVMTLGEGAVHGEIMELPLERLAHLDALEGAAPVGAPGGWYRRTVLPVRVANGVERAFAYVVDNAEQFPRIESGDWRSLGDRHAAWAEYAARTPEGER
ncbi:MAG: gamma-glutamylcyclotransferase [Rubritepida sp.]|nr:gamma-glutamylcyclotransferase [Rubritepida sp.]